MKEEDFHLVGRIDQIVRDFFESNPTIIQILAKDLMEIFIEKKVFDKDSKEGLPIRRVLRKLDSEGKLDFLKHCKVTKKANNRYWYFERK